MKFSFSLICGLLCVAAAMPAGRAGAQTVVNTGTIRGKVSDQSGGAFPAASVVLRDAATGKAYSRQTNREGVFVFPALPVGTYGITISTPSFKTTKIQSVVVQVGQTTAADAILQTGSKDETVIVTATTPLMRPAESSASTVIDRTFLEALPLNGRRYTDFTLITPNTSPDGDTGLVSIAGQQGGEDSGYANGNGSTTFTVNGTNATSNYFADILGRYRIPYLYGENGIQEFQIAVSPYSSVYGGGAGFINAVTRSGSNAFHGDAFYYNRNSATGANDALSIASGYPKPEDALQQFGVGVGGPIRRDRLWFFVDYEQQLDNSPISIINPAIAQVNETSFGIPNGTTLPAPNAPYPVPGSDTMPNPSNSVYLQQVSNTLNMLNSNLGIKARQKNDFVFTPRLDYQATPRDSLFASFNVNWFDSPGGVITVSPVAVYGAQTLANANVHDFQATVGWTHTFSSTLLNEFHFGASDDNQISTPTTLAAGLPTVLLESPTFFTLGNAPFSVGRVFERQWSVGDRVDYVVGKHTLQFGFDMTYAYDADSNDGGADPNADVEFGSPLGSYVFTSLEGFALGEYNTFTQASGNPTFSFSVPYYGFYVQDSYRVLPQLTLQMGLREDFQVYPQPAENSAFPLTGQYPNQLLRLAPRFGFAWQPISKTVVRGGFGQFYTNMNGLNYRNAVVSNGLPSQQSSLSANYNPALAPNQQMPSLMGGNVFGPAFPGIVPGNSPLFQASPDISLVSPQFKAPYVLEGSLQIEWEISRNTTVSIGTMWNHGVHLLNGSANDLNLQPPQGTTTYIVCPPGTTTAPCNGQTVVLPNLDSGLLTEGRINPNLGQINELISTGQNYYNSMYVQLQHRMSDGLSMQFSYTLAKSITLNGMDFNNQFDFSNTHAPSLLDQRHNISFAAVYQPRLERLTSSDAARVILSNWRVSSVMAFSSGRPYAALLSPACTSSTLSFSNCDGANGNLNDTAFNEDTANTADGINGGGPTPGIGLNSFYGPWLERIDVGLGRRFQIKEGKTLQFEVQAFNLFNHANFYVQNGDGINPLQYNPIGTNCGDGATPNQTCYLVPNTGPGNFGSLQEISPQGLPRVLQFSGRFTF